MIETMNRAAVCPEWAGKLAGDTFPLHRWIGGSQGAGVFLTDWSEPAVKAIIKLIPADAEDAEMRMAAWEAAETLSHPNLIEVYAHGRCEIDGVLCLYVVTEFADEVLAEILKERPLTTEETRELLGPALDALACLHAESLVHGRLNPSNIMAAGDRLKLSTDGLFFVGARARSSAQGTVYDAPESAESPIGPAADLWSLGATLVECLTQQPPQWDGHVASDPIVPAAVPQPFSAIARRCLRTDPARRGTIEAMQARLDPAKFEPAKSGPAKLEPAKRSPEPESKPTEALPANPSLVLVLAVAAILLFCVGVWKVLSHRYPGESPTEQAQTAPADASAQSPGPTPVAQPSPAEPSTATAPQAATPDATPVSPQAPETAPAPDPAAVAPPQSQPQAQPEAQPEVAPAPTDQPSAPVTAGINPAIVTQILPDIVPSALKTVNGTLRVSVEVTVGADGRISGATLASSGPSKYFAAKSLEAAGHWKFRPAAAGNWTLEFQYTRSGIHVVAQPAAP